MEYISDLNCPTFQAQIARLSFITKNWGGRPPPPSPPASYAYAYCERTCGWCIKTAAFMCDCSIWYWFDVPNIKHIIHISVPHTIKSV